MKKTLTTLLIIFAGVVQGSWAASLVMELKNVDQDGTTSLKAVDAFGNELQGVTVTTNGATISDNSFTSSSSGPIKISGNLGATMNEGWSLAFTAKLSSIATNGWPVLCGIGENNNNNFKVNYTGGTNPSWGFAPEGNYNLVEPSNSNSVDANSAHDFLITFDGNEANGGTKTLNLYIDGVLAASAQTTSDFGSDTVGVLTLGGRPLSNSNLTNGTTFSNVKLYSGVLPIPEPTTATLSLVGLASLMMRRRRSH